MVKRYYNSLQNFVRNTLGIQRYTGTSSSVYGPVKEETKTYQFIKQKAADSFLTSSANITPDPQMGTLSFFKGVSTNLSSPYPTMSLVKTRNMEALQSEITRQSVLNISDRNNNFVNQQFNLALNSSVPYSSLPSPESVTTGTTVTPPTTAKSIRKTRRRLYNPYPKGV